MNKIRVIDLLNKIANGEEVPKKIRIEHWCYKFEWVEHLYNYYDEDSDIDLTSALSLDIKELNYEVEILDEEDEFIDIEELKEDELYLTENQQIYIVHTINCLTKNQKKIIDKLKEE